jgi:hypothetical protein
MKTTQLRLDRGGRGPSQLKLFMYQSLLSGVAASQFRGTASDSAELDERHLWLYADLGLIIAAALITLLWGSANRPSGKSTGIIVMDPPGKGHMPGAMSALSSIANIMDVPGRNFAGNSGLESIPALLHQVEHLHLICHGNQKRDRFYAVDSEGRVEEASLDYLCYQISLANVTSVFLSMCFGDRAARQIFNQQSVNFVVSYEEMASDKHARLFEIGFYEGYKRTGNLKLAYTTGIASSIRMLNHQGTCAPILRMKQAHPVTATRIQYDYATSRIVEVGEPLATGLGTC